MPLTLKERWIYFSAIYLGAVFIFSQISCARAQTLQEISTAVHGNSLPGGIANGPDGALWFTDTSGYIGRVTTDGTLTELTVPTCGCSPVDITAGPDGALWFAADTKIGRVTPAGNFSFYTIPVNAGADAAANSIASGPDGALWLTLGSGKIGRITVDGVISTFPIPALGSAPASIVQGPDGAMWFADHGARAVGRITVDGKITLFAIPGITTDTGPLALATGPDGALWFTGNAANLGLGRITVDGVITPFSNVHSGPVSINYGPDGALWFTDTFKNAVGRITTTGNVSDISVPTPLALAFGFSSSLPNRIVTGPDGGLWFTETKVAKIGHIGQVIGASSLFSAILPSSRSVQVGKSATAFATIINTGAAGSNCGIVPLTAVPGNFTYQTTDPSTNALVGSPNTPVNIGGQNGSQSFVIAFTPEAPVEPTLVQVGFDCASTDAAASIPGVNTLLFSASTTPIPDIIALAASSDPGIVDLTPSSGAGAFAVATVNIGSAATITASANTGSASLPLVINLCQTDPSSGQCISSLSPRVTTAVAANQTPTFGIFLNASGAIPFDPANHRIFVEFSDSQGIVRGSTSVAVRTSP